MAVQRYARVIPIYECNTAECRIQLDGFADEAWLMMQTERTPVSISSGNYTEVIENLYLIETDAANILIGFEGDE